MGWWSSQHLGIVPLASVSPPCAVGLMPACPLTPEHVCGGLDGAEGPRAGMGPPGEELRQRHGALQGQPGPSLALHAHRAQPCPDHLAPAGVDGECRRVGCCELPDGHGGLPAGGALRGHGVQVSALAAEGDCLLPPALLTEPSLPPRITRAGLTFNPMCPVGISAVCVSGISYQGSRLDFSLSVGFVTVEVTAQAGPWAPSLEAELWPSRTRLPLPPGRPPPRPHPRRPHCVPRPTMPLSLQDGESVFPAQRVGYKGQACRPHALPHELPGRLSKDVEQLPRARRPRSGTPLGPEAS